MSESDKQTGKKLSSAFGRRAPSDYGDMIGQRIRTARDLKGFTQKQLATALDITFQQVQKYEAGTNRISASALFDVARILGQPIAYFYGKSGEEPQPTFSREELSLIRQFRSLQPEQQELIAKLIEALPHPAGPKPNGP